MALVSALILGASAAHATVAISTQPTLNMTCSNGVCTPTASKAVLNVTDLTNMLASGDTTIKSTSQNPDIEIDAPLSWTSTSRLTLDAYHSITFNKPVVVAGSGALTITTNDGSFGGDFRFLGKGHVQFPNNNNSLIINERPYTLTNNMKSLVRLVRHNASGSFAISAHIVSKKVYTESPLGGLSGILEGLGNTISGLTINSSATENAALIDQLIVGATIRDIGLTDVQITGTGGGCVAPLLAVNGGGTLANSYATGSVTTTNSMYAAGGLLCDNVYGLVRGSSSQVIVSGADNTPVGGLAGLNEGGCGAGGQDCVGLIDQSFAGGSVSGGMSGGLVGRNLGGMITNSYATGSVTGGDGAFVGGLVGSNENNDETLADPKIMYSYSVGPVSGGASATVGGLIGQDIAAPGISDAYWDLDTSGVNNTAQGAGNVPNDPGITGLSDAQLKSGLPFGFNTRFWKSNSHINNGYPYLIDNTPRK